MYISYVNIMNKCHKMKREDHCDWADKDFIRSLCTYCANNIFSVRGIIFVVQI